jgi:hypothetical protein
MKIHKNFYGYSTSSLHGTIIRRYAESFTGVETLNILQFGTSNLRDSYLINESVSPIGTHYAIYHEGLTDNTENELTALYRSNVPQLEKNGGVHIVYLNQEGPIDLIESLFHWKGYPELVTSGETLLITSSFVDTKWPTLDQNKLDGYGVELEELEVRKDSGSGTEVRVYRYNNVTGVQTKTLDKQKTKKTPHTDEVITINNSKNDNE